MVPPRILVLYDDDPPAQLCDLLATAGYTVLTRSHAALSMPELAQSPPDLLVLAWRGGHEAAGWQACKWVKYYPPTAAIPLLVYTPATPWVQEVAGFLASQGVGLVYQPVTRAALHAGLARALAPAGPRQAAAGGAEGAA